MCFQLAHTLREITFRRFHKQVVVIAHQTVDMAHPVKVLAYMIHNGQERAPVIITLLNSLSPIALGTLVVVGQSDIDCPKSSQ